MMMRGNRFTLVFAAGALIGILFFYPFRNSPQMTFWGIGSICVGYSVVILGLVRTGGKSRWFTNKINLSVQTGLLIHLVCLALISNIVYLGLQIKPHLPAWLGESHSTRRSAFSLFDISEITTLLLILAVEYIWLAWRPAEPNVTSNSEDAEDSYQK
jgi:hypothetical protein